MKHFLRVCCIALIFSILFNMAEITKVKAASEIIFVSVNNDFLELSEISMPIRRGGSIYIPYSIFCSFPGMHASYDSSNRVLVIFNWDYTMTFDIAQKQTYDEQNVQYANPGIAHNGTVYVCAEDVASKFGFFCSIINSTSGTIVRMNTEKPALSDVMFAYFALGIMKDMIQKFNTPDPVQIQTNSDSNASSSAQQSNAPSSSPVVKTIYLTFDNCTSDGVSGILDTLEKYGFKSSFFINGDFAASDGALIRRIVCGGNTVGISSFSENSELFYSGPEQMLGELSLCNQILDKNIKTKSRLVRTPDGSRNKLTPQMRSALTEAGYRLWDWDLRISSAKSSSALSSRVISSLSERENPSTVLAMNGSKLTASAADRIFKYLKDNGYQVKTISEWQTPVNFYRLKS